MAAAVSAEHEEAKNTLPEEQSASLVDVLEQIDMPAREALLDELGRLRSIGSFRLTCRALRSLADSSVRVSRPLALHLGADGAVSEPLPSLARWGRRLRDIRMDIYPPAPAPAPAAFNAFLPTFADLLPDTVRRSVALVNLTRNMGAPHAALPGPLVGSLASLLPCLRTLDLSGLQADWTAGDSGEAYSALASLGTLEGLSLPGVPAINGVEALAGSLRLLALHGKTWWNDRLTLTRSAVAPLGQLTRLQALALLSCGVDMGESPTLLTLLSLLPLSLICIELQYCVSVGAEGYIVAGSLTLSPGRIKTLELWGDIGSCDWYGAEPARHMSAPKLAALARDELLPCLYPDARLRSLELGHLWADGWGASDMGPLLELWRRSDQARTKVLHVKAGGSASDACSAIAALRRVETLFLGVPEVYTLAELPLQPSPAQPAGGPSLDLPPPEEVLRMALQRLASPTGGGQDGAEAGAEVKGVGSRVLLLRGPVALAALPEPSRTWAWGLSRRAIASAEASSGACSHGDRLLFDYVLFVPPAGAVLVECTESEEGAAEAVAGAVAALGDGSEAVRVPVRCPCPRFKQPLPAAWEGAIREVVGELWAASGGGEEGGCGLQRRVEWALGVQDTVGHLPAFRFELRRE